MLLLHNVSRKTRNYCIPSKTMLTSNFIGHKFETKLLSILFYPCSCANLCLLKPHKFHTFNYLGYYFLPYSYANLRIDARTGRSRYASNHWKLKWSNFCQDYQLTMNGLSTTWSNYNKTSHIRSTSMKVLLPQPDVWGSRYETNWKTCLYKPCESDVL